MNADSGAHPSPELVGPTLWARFVLGGEGPHLTLAEAAAVLGVSEATVRRFIREGRVQARRSDSGAYRVIPFLESASSTLEFNDALVRELAGARAELEHVRCERDELEARLAALQEAEAASQEDWASLWSRRALRPGERVGDEAFGGLAAPAGSERVRSVIVDAREVFKRRRRRWLLAG